MKNGRKINDKLQLEKKNVLSILQLRKSLGCICQMDYIQLNTHLTKKALYAYVYNIIVVVVVVIINVIVMVNLKDVYIVINFTLIKRYVCLSFTLLHIK